MVLFKARLKPREREYVVKLITIFRSCDNDTIDVIVREIDAVLTTITHKAPVLDSGPTNRLTISYDGHKYVLEEADENRQIHLRPGERQMMVVAEGKIYYLHDHCDDWGE